MSFIRTGLTTIHVEGLTQLEELNLSGNNVTLLTRAKLSRLFASSSSDNPLSGVMKPILAKKTQVNNEFNEKVAWTTQQFLNGNESDDIESALKSELKGNEDLLTLADSVDIMSQASVEFSKQGDKKRKISNQLYFPNNSLLILSKADMKENVIQYESPDSPNAFVSPA